MSKGGVLISLTMVRKERGNLGGLKGEPKTENQYVKVKGQAWVAGLRPIGRDAKDVSPTEESGKTEL